MIPKGFAISPVNKQNECDFESLYLSAHQITFVGSGSYVRTMSRNYVSKGHFCGR